MKKYLLKIYQKEQFYPRFIGVFINPFYFARLGLLNAIKKYAPQLIGSVLDIGCGTKPYAQIFIKNQYFGLDYDSPRTRMLKIADYYYDGNRFPLENETFDNALCSQVLEHVFNPNQFLLEIHRVLRQNGKLLLTVPFSWDEHEQPYDFARYTSFGLKHLLNESGFKIIRQEKTCADISILFQLLNIYIYKSKAGFPKYVSYFLDILLIGPINCFGILGRFLLPKNNDFYLDNIIVAEKL